MLNLVVVNRSQKLYRTHVTIPAYPPSHAFIFKTLPTSCHSEAGKTEIPGEKKGQAALKEKRMNNRESF